MLRILGLILLTISHVHALEMSKRDFCLSQSEAETYQSPQKFKILGDVSHPALITTVAKLVDEFEIPGPLILHFTDYVGPKKVWSLSLSDGRHVYFAKNAVDLLLGIKLQEIADEVCRPEWTGRKTFTVNYTNTVMEQFLRHAATKESLEKVLMKRTGWKLRSSPGEKHYDEEQEFRTEELVTLIKQLMDVPAEIFKKMKIKKVTRYRYGAPLPIPNANAIYYVHDQKIQFGDGAMMFNGTDIYGEGTILHEMGHAYWFGISEATRNKFSAISWEQKGDKWERRSVNSDGFITEYSMKSPEEDFAEHFSAFMHQPELLNRRAARKMRFLEDDVFVDVSFFTTVAENAKIKIDSPTPDTRDPWLDRPLHFSFEASAKRVTKESQYMDVSVSVDSARDDLSGIAKTMMSFTHRENSDYSIFVTLIPEEMPDGSYRLKGAMTTNPNELAPGLYRPGTFALKDLAGNTTYYKPEHLEDLYLDGKLSLTTIMGEKLDPNKIKIEPAQVINGYHGVITTLPIKYRENLKGVHLNWEMTDLDTTTTNVCSTYTNPSVPCLVDPVEGENLKIKSYFYKEYPRTTVKLASVNISFKGTTTEAKSSENYVIPQTQRNTTFVLDSGSRYLDLIDVEVNQMKLKAITEENREGGTQNIQVTIPLVNSKAGGFSISAQVRSPTGKMIYKTVYSRGSDYEMVNNGDEKIIRFKIPLKKNPEDGEYILESFEVKTEYEAPQTPYLPIDLNYVAKKKVKLLERGIRRTFTISDDKVINLN